MPGFVGNNSWGYYGNEGLQLKLEPRTIPMIAGLGHLSRYHPHRVPADFRDEPGQHSDPPCHPFDDWSDATGTERSSDMATHDDPPIVFTE